MRLTITSHLLRRMAERGITRDQIDEALNDLVSEWPTPKGSVQYLGRTRDGRLLIVWLVEPGMSTPSPIVKSAAWK